MREPKLKGNRMHPQAIGVDAWLKVKDNGGAAAADGVTIEQFEEDFWGYMRLWNRMLFGVISRAGPGGGDTQEG